MTLARIRPIPGTLVSSAYSVRGPTFSASRFSSSSIWVESVVTTARLGPRTSEPATQSCCASPIRIPCRPGSPTLISTTTSASLSSPAFGGRSTATAITIGTSPSYGTSREAASNCRRSTSAASGTWFSRCSETPAPHASALPDLRGLHLLPGCGHWTQQERPQAVNDHLLAWLRGL